MKKASGRLLGARGYDLRYAREVDLAAFRRRPWYRHVAEWAANQTTPLP